MARWAVTYAQLRAQQARRRHAETGTPVIMLTRLNGERFAVNVDLIERAETTPDTVIRMVDGAKYVVTESLEEVIDKVTNFKASVLRLAGSPEPPGPGAGGDEPEGRHLRLLPDREDPRQGVPGAGEPTNLGPLTQGSGDTAPEARATREERAGRTAQGRECRR